MERTENENILDREITKDVGTMRILGIDPDSKGAIYLPAPQLRGYVIGEPIRTEYTLGFLKGSYQIFDGTGNSVGNLFQTEEDIFTKTCPNLELHPEHKAEIVDHLSEMSKWLPLIEQSINPITEELDFYKTRLILAANLFTDINSNQIGLLKVAWMEGVKNDNLILLTAVEKSLEEQIAKFTMEHPKFLEFFGTSEDYLYNMVHAQLTLPTLVANRHKNKTSDDLTNMLLQDIAERDISVLTAFMMHRTTNHLTGEVQNMSQVDAETSQIIAIAEIPPEEFLSLDNVRRSAFANMLGIYQDIFFKEVYPEIYELGNDELERLFPGWDYLTRTHFILKVLPKDLGMEIFNEYDPENTWTEVSAKSAVSSTRKCSLKYQEQIKKISNFYNFSQKDPNFRLDLFNRLLFVLRKRGGSPQVQGMVQGIKQKLKEIELVRFRLYPQDNEFNEFIEHQIRLKQPELILDVYQNDNKSEELSRRFEYDSTEQQHLQRLEDIKKHLIENNKNISHLYLSLHWRKQLYPKGPTSSFQVAPLSFLKDNYQTREVFLM